MVTAGASDRLESVGRNVQVYVPPFITVITIGPSRVYSDSADTMCYEVSPAPASIKAGGQLSLPEQPDRTSRSWIQTRFHG